MPVERYRSVEAMPDATPRVEDPREALRRMAALVRLARVPDDPGFEPGVHKYRSIEEAQQARDAVEEERVRWRPDERRATRP